MPRNNGVYTLPPVYFAESGETIQPNQHNIPLQDIAQALTGSVPRDGSANMTGNLPMGGRKVTGLGTATAPGDAVRLDQVIPNTGWLSSVAALPMVADRIPYATGAASAALAVFTAAGRAIVGASDAAAQRVAMGLGALATKNKAAVADIDATGAASATTFLRGDGSWTALPLQKSYVSAQQEVTAGGLLDLTHGLGSAPKLVQCSLVITGSVSGYNNGDEVLIGNATSGDAASNRGMSIVVTSTNIKVRFGSSTASFSLVRADNGSFVNPGNSDIKLIVRAWA